MNQNAKALKSGVWYIVSNMLIRGMALITTPVFTRIMSQEKVGEYSNFSAWLNIGLIVFTMRMESSLISAKFDYQDRLDEYNRSVIALSAVITAVWALVLNLFPGFFSDRFGFGMLYVNLLLVYCFFHAVINLFQVNERYHYRYKKSVFAAMLTSVSVALVSITFVLIMPDAFVARVLGTVLPIAMIGAVLIWTFFSGGRSVDPKVWPYAIKICLPYVPHLLSLTLLNQLDRIMIKRICGASDAAMYSIAYTCGHIATLLMTSMNGAFSPWLGEQLNQGNLKEIRKVTRLYAPLFCVMVVGMMLLAPEVLMIMGPKSYQQAKYVMPPVAMGCACQFLYTLYVNVEQYSKKTSGMAVASVLAAGLNYGLNALLIPKYGYLAAAYTTLVGYMFLLFSHMFLSRKLKLDQVIDTRLVFVILFILMIIAVGVNYLYNVPVLRYAVILCYIAALVIVILKNREMVKKLIRMIVK